MKYTDFGTQSDGKTKRVRMMKQFQAAQMRINKGIKNAKDYALVYGDTVESWEKTFTK